MYACVGVMESQINMYNHYALVIITKMKMNSRSIEGKRDRTCARGLGSQEILPKTKIN
jgi:hypothetical protein